MILCGLFRGPGSKPSIIGVTRCDKLDFTFLIFLFLSAVILTKLATVLMKIEYDRKEAVGYNFVTGDIRYTNRNTFNMVAISLICGFLVATMGFGPGALFAPLLLSMDINAAVAAATSLYLTMFTAGSATLNTMVFQLINTRYSILINIITLLGTIPGVYG